MVVDRYGGSPAISEDAGVFSIPGKRLLTEIRE